jgi:pimeloyl-ACP methyl ester carboxylesterase
LDSDGADHRPRHAHRTAATHRTIVRALARKPAIIGHSFGGLLAQILAGHGLSAATVAIDPAPFRGVLPRRSRRSAPRCRC